MQEYIQSGIIESYVLGITTSEETTEVEEMADNHDEIRKAIDEFGHNLEQNGLVDAIPPSSVIKPMFMATIDYNVRIEEGEIEVVPPLLSKKSTIEDYAYWINRHDMVIPENFKDFYAKIIGNTSQAKTAIIWMQDLTFEEVHYFEFEKFLIIEGTLDIIIEEDVHSLNPGDFLKIPLYKSHQIKVTSTIACKAILQRVAA